MHKEDEIMMIVTDTASDILESEAAELGIRLAPLDIAFGDVHCSRNTPAMLDEFYRLLTTSDEFPKTSQPAPDTWLGLFREAQENDEDVLVLTMTSDISGTYDSACMAAHLSGYEDRIAVWWIRARRSSANTSSCAMRRRNAMRANRCARLSSS